LVITSHPGQGTSVAITLPAERTRTVAVGHMALRA
jgi:signal transduction histidine kinase